MTQQLREGVKARKRTSKAMEDVGGDERKIRRVNRRTNGSRDAFISEETY